MKLPGTLPIRWILLTLATCTIIGVFVFFDTGRYKPISISSNPPHYSVFDGDWSSIENHLTPDSVSFSVKNGWFTVKDFPVFSQFEDRGKFADPQIEYVSEKLGSSFERTPSGWALKVGGQHLIITTWRNRYYLRQFRSVDSMASIVYAKRE